MDKKGKKRYDNMPIPVNSDTGLQSIQEKSDDIMIVSDGELLSEASERLPEKVKSQLSGSSGGAMGDPERVTHINTDDLYDDNLGGGYASVKGEIKRQNKFIWIVLIVMAVVCIVTNICTAIIVAKLTASGSTPPVIDTDTKHQQIAAVVRGRKQCVVEISAGFVSGSGLITTMSGGKIYIITNQHVIDNGVQPSVRFEGSDDFYYADIVGYDRTYDLAVLSVNSSVADYSVYDLENSKYFSRGVSYSEGDTVVAIGNAIGHGIASYDGIVSRAAELIDYDDGAFSRTMPVMRTTAAINAGMSGGPVFDMSGSLLGIGSYRITSQSTDPNAGHKYNVESTGLVVPMSIVYPVYKHILAYGGGDDSGISNIVRFSKPASSAIGAAVISLTGYGTFTAQYKGGELTVTSLDYGTPPKGIQVGDVIKKIGGYSLCYDASDASENNTIDDSSRNVCAMCGELLCYRYGYTEGEQLKLTLERGLSTVEVTVPGYGRFVE